MISITAPVKSYKYFRGDELDPGGDAGGGEEVGEDVGDRPQPTQAGAEDEVFLFVDVDGDFEDHVEDQVEDVVVDYVQDGPGSVQAGAEYEAC